MQKKKQKNIAIFLYLLDVRFANLELNIKIAFNFFKIISLLKVILIKLEFLVQQFVY